MLQMCQNCVAAFGNHQLHHLGFIIGFGFTLFHGNGTFGAVSDTGAKSVAEQVADQPGFPVNNLQCTFVAIRYTIAASVAQIFINFNNGPFHRKYSDYINCDKVVFLR